MPRAPLPRDTLLFFAPLVVLALLSPRHRHHAPVPPFVSSLASAPFWWQPCTQPAPLSSSKQGPHACATWCRVQDVCVCCHTWLHVRVASVSAVATQACTSVYRCALSHAQGRAVSTQCCGPAVYLSHYTVAMSCLYFADTLHPLRFFLCVFFF